ncbi:MAG: glucosyltransferase domain-containing protein, partial [Candidatus Nitrosotenuis sp.]
MSKLLSNIGILISFLLIFTVAYLPAIQMNYLMFDDYNWIWTEGHQRQNQLLKGPIIASTGRMEHYFMYIIYGSLNHFQSLDFARGLRFLGVILLSLFAYILTIIFKTNHIKTKYAFIGSILVCTLPAYQLYVSWLMGVYMILGVLLSSLASLIMFKVGINWNSTKPFYRKTAISLSIFLPVIALLIYQPTAMIYFAMAVVPLTMLTAEDLTKKWQAPFIRYFSVGFASLSIYFLIVKMVLFVKKVGVHPKGKFISLSEISERIEWFIYSG